MTCDDLSGLLAVSAVTAQTTDQSYDGIFSTPSADNEYIDLDEYNQPEDKQDQFDWKLSKVRTRLIRQASG